MINNIVKKVESMIQPFFYEININHLKARLKIFDDIALKNANHKIRV